MKKLFILLFLIQCNLIGMKAQNEITLPDQATVKKLIENTSSSSYIAELIKHTNLQSKLAGRRMTPSEIRKVVFDAVYDFYQDIKNGKLGATFDFKFGNPNHYKQIRVLILKSILRNHPEAIKELEQQGLLDFPTETQTLPHPRNRPLD